MEYNLFVKMCLQGYIFILFFNIELLFVYKMYDTILYKNILIDKEQIIVNQSIHAYPQLKILRPLIPTL